MKKTDFLKFLGSKYACSESKDWIKSLPVEDIDAPIWAKYLAEAQPDWAVWLAENIRGGNSVEYERIRDAARAKYERVEALDWVEYERIKALDQAEYNRARDTARAEYERVTADTARKLLTFEAVSKEVDNFLKAC